LSLVYEELRKLAAQKMAQEKPGQTLQATALVPEVYRHLKDRDSGGPFSAASVSRCNHCSIEAASLSAWSASRISTDVRALATTKCFFTLHFFCDRAGRFDGICCRGITTMPMRSEPDTEHLLDAAACGDDLARGQLLERHRPRLRRMIAFRLDRRLAARVDPSDVVQETLAEAAAKLDDYLRQRPLPFYPWLRRLAQEQLADVCRRHLRAGRRSVTREEPAGLPDESVLELAERLLDAGSGPSARLRRVERQALVRQALDRLPEGDREVLVLRYLEQLSTAEAAAVLEIGESAVKMRLLRALQRLRDVLKQSEDGP